MKMEKVLDKLGIEKNNEGASTGTKWLKGGGGKIESYSPVDGKKIATVTTVTNDTYDKVIEQAQAAFVEWRMWPAIDAASSSYPAILNIPVIDEIKSTSSFNTINHSSIITLHPRSRPMTSTSLIRYLAGLALVLCVFSLVVPTMQSHF